MAHFTYVDTPDKDKLNQGDVLKKTEEIKALLEQVHPHYSKEDYQYFCVVSQTCDLVRRTGSPPKSPYITLAAVRPFELFLNREVSKFQKDEIDLKARLVKNNVKALLAQQLERLFNNNELEYFYFHEDASIGFPQSVAFLRLSIAIKSSLHYDTCLNAKRLQLKDNFQAKLGWLVGNMYSRVGTKDWVPETLKDHEFKKMIEKILEDNFIWVDEKKLKVLKTSLEAMEIGGLEQEEILAELDKIKIKTKKEMFIERLQTILYDGGYMETKKVRAFMTNIKQDSELGQLFKQ